jgi:hypothetical protein
MRIVVLLLLLAPALAAEPLGRKEAHAIEAAARGLARKGRSEALAELLEILRELGHPPDAIARLGRSCRNTLARSKKRASAAAEARKLSAVARELEEGLAALPQRDRVPRARAILRLDGERERARRVLGHVRRGGGWVLAESVPLLARRTEIEEAVRRARRLKVEIETGPSDLPTLVELGERSGSMARHGTVRIHAAALSPKKLERILRQVLRACALSQFLQGGELAVPVLRRVEGVWLRQRGDYARSIDVAAQAGVMNAEQVAWARPLTGYKDPRGWYVFVPEIEADCQARFFYYLFAAFTARTQACLEAGHLNWICLSFFGIPMHSVAWVEEKERRVPATRTAEHDRIERERMLRLRRAGLAGTRSWMAWLAARGEDPRWKDSFVDVVGKIAGNDLLKCTMVNEYVQEAGLLGRLMSGSRNADIQSPDAIAAAIEKVLGEDLVAFERRWKRWILPVSSGLVQRLEAGATPARGDRGPLDRLEEIRRQALREQDRHALELDPDLSAGAEAHARYLVRHPAQQSKWPDAHEEYADQEGFSVEGCRAGASSVITFGVKEPADAIDDWMGTFFHRLPLLHPGIVRVGWGLAGGVAVLDCTSMCNSLDPRTYVLWPPKGARNVPRRFHAELPNPVPGEDQSRWGYPITVQFFGYAEEPQVEMSLHEGTDRDGPAVPCHFTTPQAPLSPDLAPAGAFCLIPKTHLKANRDYTVVARRFPSGEGPMTWSWSFRTGR